MTDKTCRLQNVIADTGIASRRKSADIIMDGRVSVNGAVNLEPGARVDPSKDAILLDGRKLPAKKQSRTVIALNKPAGYICSADDSQGQTIYDLLEGVPDAKSLDIAGRLDKESEGLVILTDDGDLINQLTHPRYGKKKTYEVTVYGRVTKEQMAKLNSRMVIDDYTINPAKVSVSCYNTAGKGTTLEFILTEGRNRQIRNMCRQLDLYIYRLTRTAINRLTLANLKPGSWKRLAEKELRLLM